MQTVMNFPALVDAEGRYGLLAPGRGGQRSPSGVQQLPFLVVPVVNMAAVPGAEHLGIHADIIVVGTPYSPGHIGHIVVVTSEIFVLILLAGGVNVQRREMDPPWKATAAVGYIQLGGS